MLIFWGFIIIIGSLYFILTGFIFTGWIRTRPYELQDGIDQPTVSVIIPFRDDAAGLSFLLNDLADQNYSKSRFEVIVVDDHSANPKYVLPSELESGIRIRRLNLDNNEHGKRAALIKGLNASDSELILTSDADCRVTPFWITEMSNYYISRKVKLVFGSVLYPDSKKMDEMLQSLEYLSLMAAGAGFAGNGYPIICSAANMGFERTIYLEYIRDNKSSFPISGDDVMFMLWLKKRYFGQIGFIKSLNSVVITKPTAGIKEFINQRLRWTSKSRYYRDPAIILTASMVYLESLLLLVLLVGSFFNGSMLKGFIILFLVKCIGDLVLLLIVTRYYRNRYLLLIFLPLEIIYFIYISIIGFAGNILSFDWKGRRSGSGKT